MPDGKSFEQLEKEKKEAKAAEPEKKEVIVVEEDDEFEEFEQEGASLYHRGLRQLFVARRTAGRRALTVRARRNTGSLSRADR